MMHHARPDPAPDPVCDNIAKNGSSDRPPYDRRRIKFALLNGEAGENHDQGGREKKPNEDKGLAERNHTEDGASPFFVMEHI
jgi:hypothetical protein